MWMIELAMKTIAADSRMGNQRAVSDTMGPPELQAGVGRPDVNPIGRPREAVAAWPVGGCPRPGASRYTARESGLLGETAMNLIISLVIGGVIGWLASIVMKTNAQM